MDKLIDFGINPKLGEGAKDYSQNQACMRKDELNNKAFSESAVDDTKVKAWFDEFCKGRATCAAKFNLNNKDVTNKSLMSTSTNGWITKGSGFCTNDSDTNCVNKMSKFFMQHTCTVNGDEFKDKYNKIALASSCITFIAFCFGALIYYMKKTSKLDQLNYDMNTITAGDFTVEMDITDSQYGMFLGLRDENKDNKFERRSIGMDFREFIKKHIEDELTLERKKKKEEEDAKAQEAKNKAFSGSGIFNTKRDSISRRHLDADPNQDPNAVKEVKIVDIQFAYNNYELINLLKKRGTAITSLDFEKMRQLETEITDMVMNT